MDWIELRQHLTTATATCAQMLRSGVDAQASVRGLDWNVGQLGAHLVSLPRLYRSMLDSDNPFDLPSDVPAHNRSLLDAVETADPAQLADFLEADMAELVDAYGDDGQRQVNHWVSTQPVIGIGGIALAEVLVHSRDLASATGDRVNISREQAIACLDGVLPAAANVVDETAAKGLSGVVHVNLRGGDHWTQTLENGSLHVERGRPKRADFHISADPVTFLLAGNGRIGQARATLSGKIVGYGKRPRFASAFSTIFVDL